MTANPLKVVGSRQHFTSGIRACHWAKLARDKGLMKHAEAWEKADREGWDERHYQPPVSE